MSSEEIERWVKRLGFFTLWFVYLSNAYTYVSLSIYQEVDILIPFKVFVLVGLEFLAIFSLISIIYSINNSIEKRARASPSERQEARGFVHCLVRPARAKKTANSMHTRRLVQLPRLLKCRSAIGELRVYWICALWGKLLCGLCPGE
jgi:hypothetical protein